jgi:hypothetical protein
VKINDDDGEDSADIGAFVTICPRTGRALFGKYPIDSELAATLRLDRQLRHLLTVMLRNTDELVAASMALETELELAGAEGELEVSQRCSED